MLQLSRRLARIGAISTTLLLVSSTATIGIDDIDPGLEPGDWVASAYANGKGTAKSGSMKVVWTMEIPAQFAFRVAGDGQPKGNWRYEGDATNKLTGRFQGRRVTGKADLDMSGKGQVGGSNKRLKLTGTGRQKGAMVLTAREGTVSFDINQKSKAPTLRLPVGATTCDEAYGEWASTLKQGLQRQGFKASATGYWMGFRDTDIVRDGVTALLDQFRTTPRGTAKPISKSPLMEFAAGLMHRYAGMDGSETVEEFEELFDETESILNHMRNLSECDKRLFGEENVERFVNALTFVLQGLIEAGALDPSEYTDEAGTWATLAQAGVRSGAIGAGAVNPDLAASAESTLMAQAESILESNLHPDGNSLLANDDTRTVITQAAAMGWILEAGGMTYDAREVLAGMGQVLELAP